MVFQLMVGQGMKLVGVGLALGCTAVIHSAVRNEPHGFRHIDRSMPAICTRGVRRMLRAVAPSDAVGRNQSVAMHVIGEATPGQ